MIPEKHGKDLTRWLLTATVVLLALVLGLQLGQMFGRTTPGTAANAPPQAASSPEQPQPPAQAPAAPEPQAPVQAPADAESAPAAPEPQVPAAAAQAPASGTPVQQQPGGFIGEEAAKSAALAHAGVSAADAGYVECKLDEDDGRWVYELEFRAGGVEYDYEIDAAAGAVLKSGQEWGGGTQGSASLIGEDAAKSAALDHAGVSAQDADYIRCELDRDGGVQMYEIEFAVGGVEYEYEIDAAAGTVLKAEQDR